MMLSFFSFFFPIYCSLFRIHSKIHNSQYGQIACTDNKRGAEAERETSVTDLALCLFWSSRKARDHPHISALFLHTPPSRRQQLSPLASCVLCARRPKSSAARFGCMLDDTRINMYAKNKITLK